VSGEEELERLLRAGRQSLPEPDTAVTAAARGRALRTIRRRRRARVVALIGSTLVLAAAAGLGVATLVTPGVTAAEGEVGIGFLPEPGWSALQAPARSPVDQPAVTMAANVPFASEDVVNGLAEPSALPYATLLRLPPRGIVLVASFIATDEYPPGSLLPRYPVREQPLRIRDATPYVELGTAIRPDQPLGQYQLHAAVEGWSVEVVVYFGTSRPTRRQLTLAQRQLDGLVIRPAPSTGGSRPGRAEQAQASRRTAVVDRTFACTPGFIGGQYSIETRVHDGSGLHAGAWDAPPLAAIGTSATGAAQTAVENYLAWIAGGAPTRTASVTPTFGSWTFPFRTWGTVSVNLDLCRRVAARVPLVSKGLEAKPVGVFDDPHDCATPRRILLRVRATVRDPGKVTTYRSYLRTTESVRSAEIAVRTPSGRPVAFAQVLESGTARLFTAKGCVQD